MSLPVDPPGRPMRAAEPRPIRDERSMLILQVAVAATALVAAVLVSFAR